MASPELERSWRQGWMQSRVEQAVMRADLCGTFAGAVVLGREPDQKGPKATLTEPRLHHASSSG